tara:strand:- start:448 stop:864 length:417 start_codon:yes stop_codon:yes gene_type:complete
VYHEKGLVAANGRGKFIQVERFHKSALSNADNVVAGSALTVEPHVVAVLARIIALEMARNSFVRERFGNADTDQKEKDRRKKRVSLALQRTSNVQASNSVGKRMLVRATAPPKPLHWVVLPATLSLKTLWQEAKQKQC